MRCKPPPRVPWWKHEGHEFSVGVNEEIDHDPPYLFFVYLEPTRFTSRAVAVICAEPYRSSVEAGRLAEEAAKDPGRLDAPDAIPAGGIIDRRECFGWTGIRPRRPDGPPARPLASRALRLARRVSRMRLDLEALGRDADADGLADVTRDAKRINDALDVAECELYANLFRELDQAEGDEAAGGWGAEKGRVPHEA